MKNKFLSTILAAALAVTTLVAPVSAADGEAVDITQKQFDISADFNYSSWGCIGDTVGENFLSAPTLGAFCMDGITKTSHTLKDGDDTITFEFDAETYKGDVNNLYSGEAGSKYSISDSGNYAKNIYFAICNRINHGANYTVTLTYSDQTTETKTLKTANINQNNGGVLWNALESYAGSKLVIGKNYTGITVPGGVIEKMEKNQTVGIPVWKLSANSEKKLVNIDITNPSSAAICLYAVAETVMSNAELKAVVDEAEAVTSVTAQNAAQIFLARKYADELVARNAAVEADFETLNSLVEDAEWYEQASDGEQIMIDISDKLNIDTIAPLGSQVEAAWNEGLSAANPTAWGASWKYPWDSDIVSTYANGIRSIDEYVYELNEDGETYSFVKSGKVIKFSTPENTFSAGVKDAIELPGAGEAINVKASGNLVDTLYLLWTSTGSWADPSVTVYYEDGSSETTKVKMCGYKWASDSSDQAKMSYPNLAGLGFFGWTKYLAQENTDDNYYTVVENGSSTAGVTAFYIDVDSTKKVKSYDIVPGTQYVSYLYAMTEAPMTNAELQDVIDEAREIEIVMTEEEAELARTAAVYAKELDERHVTMLQDNADILKLAQQAEAQDAKYLDLSSMVDADIIVKVGETRPESYNGRDDLLINADKNGISGGTVTLSAPGAPDNELADKNPETGAVFKLSGGYTGNGNDAVAVNKGSNDVNFSIDGQLIKHISFLTDTVDSSVSKDKGGIVQAVINYTDGTNDEVSATLRRTDTWYSGQYTASSGIKFAHYDSAANTYVEGRAVENVDTGAVLTGFGFDIPTFKEIASVTLKSSETYSYNVLAVTATPYTNEELADVYTEFENTEITEASEVTDANAQAVVNGYIAMKELYNRGYAGVTEEDISGLAELYNEGLKYLIDEDVLTFTPSVAVSGDKVTASVNMVNTTDKDKTYVLIVAAYNSANKLLDFKATEASTLKAGTASDTNQVSMDVPADSVSYKAMVWESLSSMVPLAVAGK